MVNIDYLYNPEAAKVYFDDNYFVDKKLGFQVIEHGTILPYKHIINGKTTIDYWGYGGIVDKNGKFIKSSHVHYGAGSYYTPPRINSTSLRNSHLSRNVSQYVGTRNH